MPKVLWWGRYDPEYSRNRILRQLFTEFGWTIEDFKPYVSELGHLQALSKRLSPPDLVWVPCFRQRDLSAAYKFCRRNGVQLVFDLLISAYDKQVFEREKFLPESSNALKLLNWEKNLLRYPDAIIADTEAHADFFTSTLGADSSKLFIIPVGAEENLFKPLPKLSTPGSRPLEVLFYGSFIPLQGPNIILEAAHSYRGPEVVWSLIGDGPLLQKCRDLAGNLKNVIFEPWIAYDQLPERIQKADILLGIFGTTPKALRVIPNKVYQSAACGKPLITMRSPAYPKELLELDHSGLQWVSPGNARELASAVAGLAAAPAMLGTIGLESRASYDRYFSSDHIRRTMEALLASLGFCHKSTTGAKLNT